jgi:hypothetical protein
MNTLFNIDEFAQDSPRLAEIKAADIQTHHAPHMEEPWMAIPMKLAKEHLGDHITADEPLNTIADITASYGILLEDDSLLFFGSSKEEVENAALDAVAKYKKP